MIFERLDFPPLLSVLRRNRFAQVRDATSAYEAGHPHGIADLPKFERSKWIRMQQYYNISQSLRKAATLARLSQRWCNSFQNVIHPETLDPPKVLKTRKARYSSYDPARSPQEFHGSYTPEYFATHLYNDLSSTVSRVDLQRMNTEVASILGFAAGHPVFASLRRIDIVFRVDPNRVEVARRHADDIVRCVEEEWKRRNLRDGVVQIYCEVSTEWRDYDWENTDETLWPWTEEDLARDGTVSLTR